jgi:Cu+-exporting ATPase
MVFQILSDNDMCTYYEIEDLPGISPKGHFEGRFGFLDDPAIEEKILRFKDDRISLVEFRVPKIHCSSCIWLLENLERLHPGILDGQVNFPKKKVQIRFKNQEMKLGEVADLLASLGYEPDVNLGDLDNERIRPDRALVYQLGVAGFAFGNIMLFALPEYFALEGYWIEVFGPFFRWLSLGLSLPVFFYSARPYFDSAFMAMKRRYINIDLPISLGMIVLFTRSVYEVLWDVGTGYFDSLAGLVFFLLLGRLFQSRTYAHLNFERDYKAYFPIAVTRKEGNSENSVAVTLLEKGNRIIIRHGELIPCDASLIKGEAWIDNSFVTGEANPVEKRKGEKIYAGGRQMGGRVELEVLRTVSQSYLTQLWNHSAFQEGSEGKFKNLTDQVSKYFTIAILLIALVSGTYWFSLDSAKAAQVVTAVLIVACPCALALSAPFALGNMSRLFGRSGMYVKKPEVIEKFSEIDAFALDKTGTMTYGKENDISFHGPALSEEDIMALKALFGQSNHPLSRWIDEHLVAPMVEASEFEEQSGSGIEALINGERYKAGSARYIGADDPQANTSRVYVSRSSEILGHFEIRNKYRAELPQVLGELKKDGPVSIMTGDIEAEEMRLRSMLGGEAELMFRMKPEDKLKQIEQMQSQGMHVMMVGDGLNDAGALKQSDVGVSISEDITSFTPGSDAILTAEKFGSLPQFLSLSHATRRIILFSFGISFAYNVIGLTFAVTGNLSPVVAAILMPVSSISVVAFATIATNFSARNLRTL